MKRLVLAALLLALPPGLSSGAALAQENIVTIVVTSPATSSIIQQWTMTTEEFAKFEAWLAYAYPCKPTGPPPARQCDVPIDAQIESIKLWQVATINGTVNNVNSAGAQKLAADAIAGGTPIQPQMASPSSFSATTKKEGKKK